MKRARTFAAAALQNVRRCGQCGNWVYGVQTCGACKSEVQ